MNDELGSRERLASIVPSGELNPFQRLAKTSKTSAILEKLS